MSIQDLKQTMYIGDAVYATYDGYGILLDTRDGISISSKIYLEPEVFHNLVAFAKRRNILRED